MYGLPADFDSRIFVDRTLVQVCVFSNQIAFHFDQNISVRLEGEYSLQVDSAAEPEMIEIPEFHPGLTKLLDARVKDTSSTRDGTLVLQFSDGAVLTFYDRSPGYERYEISIGDRHIIV